MIENATLVGSSNNFYVSHLCPEVALFEPEKSIPGLSGYPTTCGQYDKYDDPKYKLLETGHFSECAEFITITQKNQPSIFIPQDLVRGGRLDNSPSTKSRLYLKKVVNQEAFAFAATICTIIGTVIAVLVALYGDGLLRK